MLNYLKGTKIREVSDNYLKTHGSQISSCGQVINMFFFILFYAYQPIQRLVLPNIFLKPKQIYKISANLSIMLAKQKPLPRLWLVH